jgi:hypothetical protein
LVVASACAAVCEACGAFFLGDFHHLGGYERSAEAGAYGVFAFVEGVGFDGWKNVVLRKLVFGIYGVVLECAEFFGFFFRGFEVLVLSDVYGYCDDVGFVFFLKPLDEDRGVESAGVGEYYFFLYVCSPIFDCDLFPLPKLRCF